MKPTPLDLTSFLCLCVIGIVFFCFVLLSFAWIFFELLLLFFLV